MIIKELNTKEAVEIAKSVFWVGMYLENEPFQCHPYLIKNGSESILIDPGSMLEFNETIRKIKTVTDLKNIKYIIIHHQDPDLVAAVPEIEKLIDRKDLLIVTHSRMSALIKHYLITSKYYEIDKNENRLVTLNGFILNFYTTPYCHSPGAFVSYEPTTKTLFSSDIFGGIEESWDFFADENYFEKAKLFHQEYMPSKDIFNYALKKIENLDLELIAPQHGSIIQKKYIKGLIEKMKNLDCGLYIEEKYNRELVDTINELKEKEKYIQERDFLLAEQSKRAEIGEMMGNIAHQWRQPLAIINASVAILKEKNYANLLQKDEIEDKLQKIENRILYLSHTIEDFMNYYKPTKEKAYFIISSTIKKALDILNMTSNKDVMVTLDIDSKIELYGLENEFMQVIVSILSNINDLILIKNLNKVNIFISTKNENGFVVIRIMDDCGGIKDENIGKIFDPYFTTKHKSMGVGLGLYIAKMIVEKNMNGELSVKNSMLEDSMGAEFTIKI